MAGREQRGVGDRVAALLDRLPAHTRSRIPVGLRTLVRHGLGRRYPWEPGFDFRAPDPDPGETVGPPDFVGIGVQKAGTSWWHSLLCAHPAVNANPRFQKERDYFLRFAFEPFTDADRSAYAAWFPRRPGELAGEWTPGYLDLPYVADLVHEVAPEARLLVMVRDPVERFLSGLAHLTQRGAVTDGVLVADALARGFYARLLERWTEVFGSDRLLVLQYESCVREPQRELSRSYAFLGLDPGFVPEGLTRGVNVTYGAKTTLDERARRRLVAAYRDDVVRLAARFHGLDLSLWPNFAP